MSNGAVMTGLWIEDGTLSLRPDLPVPNPADGEVRLQVLCAGICSTDLEILRGYAGFTGVPGHEFVGRVEEGQGDLSGRRVVGDINAACGRCATCQAGRPGHCPGRTVLGIIRRQGVFARSVCLPRGNLHLVPDAMPDETAVFTEPLAAALEIQEQVDIGPEQMVLVIGAGRLGQLIARSLLHRGCHLTVVGRHPGKRDLLEQQGIATVSAEGITPGAFDLVAECTGNPEGFALARSAVRPKGTIVLKSTYAERMTMDISALVVDEITLVGSRCGPFAKALKMLADGQVKVNDLVTASYPLSAGVAAFAAAQQPGAIKILLRGPD